MRRVDFCIDLRCRVASFALNIRSITLQSPSGWKVIATNSYHALYFNFITMQSHEANSSRWKYFPFPCAVGTLTHATRYCFSSSLEHCAFKQRSALKRRTIFHLNFTFRRKIFVALDLSRPLGYSYSASDDETSRLSRERDSNCKTVDADDYCGLYLGSASAVPLCVQICVIIDTRWDHELKHEWVLIRRSLSMSNVHRTESLL